MKESLPRAGRKKGRKGMIKKGTTIGIEGGIEMGTGRETDIGIGIETKIITPETEIETALKNGVREGKGVGIEMMMTIIRGETTRGSEIMIGIEKTGIDIVSDLAPGVDRSIDQDHDLVHVQKS
ncbi:uncharacterized protein LOC130784825 isoform X1 [Actinidia eriantha]|uniref:uncharacterized protein LOC130784825 isoform X1 n=1 Tax=Actinidia eriantha TaxID=165200 RepID=UPI0025898321|nr:uncharacterized protein LOC130784825 isoform X1 [Actinidia eriantha]